MHIQIHSTCNKEAKTDVLDTKCASQRLMKNTYLRLFLNIFLNSNWIQFKLHPDYTVNHLSFCIDYFSVTSYWAVMKWIKSEAEGFIGVEGHQRQSRGWLLHQ